MEPLGIIISQVCICRLKFLCHFPLYRPRAAPYTGTQITSKTFFEQKSLQIKWALCPHHLQLDNNMWKQVCQENSQNWSHIFLSTPAFLGVTKGSCQEDPHPVYCCIQPQWVPCVPLVKNTWKTDVYRVVGEELEALCGVKLGLRALQRCDRDPCRHAITS